MMVNPVPPSYREWHGYEEKTTEWRHFMCMNTFERVLLCLFSPHLMFFIIDNQRGIHSYQLRQLPCYARGARAHNLFSHEQLRFFFFPWIDSGVYYTKLTHFRCIGQILRILSYFIQWPIRNSFVCMCIVIAFLQFMTETTIPPMS